MSSPIGSPEFSSFQTIPAIQFNTALLTGTYQPMNATGFAADIKIAFVYNGSAVAIDFSYDGINLAGVWPAGATLAIDLQTNHADNSAYGAGTLYGRQGQLIWVRTSVNPTYLTVSGYR
jgi:hypothetical protein